LSYTPHKGGVKVGKSIGCVNGEFRILGEGARGDSGSRRQGGGGGEPR